MVLLVGYIVLIILNLLLPKSKVLYFIDFIFMWVLMGWNHSVADYNVYLTRYTNPEIYGSLEPVYVMFQNIGKMAGLDYNQFLIAMSFLFLLLRMVLISIMSEKPNYVIGLYLLFPFIMDITQLRMFYATTIVLIGMLALVKETKYCNWIFAVTVILASMIHAACAMYLLVLIVRNIKRISIKSYIYLCVIVCAVLYFLLVTGILFQIASLISSMLGFGKKFVETVISTSNAYKVTHKITYMIEILLFFVGMNTILHRMLYVKKSENNIMTYDNKEYKIVKLCYMINYMMLILLPLAWFSGDIYRVQHGMMMLFYIAFSNYKQFRSKLKGSISIKQLVLAIFIFAFMLLFLIGLPSLRDSVFWPVFKKNILFG